MDSYWAARLNREKSNSRIWRWTLTKRLGWREAESTVTSLNIFHMTLYMGAPLRSTTAHPYYNSCPTVLAGFWTWVPQCVFPVTWLCYLWHTFGLHEALFFFPACSISFLGQLVSHWGLLVVPAPSSAVTMSKSWFGALLSPHAQVSFLALWTGGTAGRCYHTLDACFSAAILLFCYSRAILARDRFQTLPLHVWAVLSSMPWD